MKITKSGAVSYVGRTWRASTFLIFISCWNTVIQGELRWEWLDFDEDIELKKIVCCIFKTVKLSTYLTVRMTLLPPITMIIVMN